MRIQVRDLYVQSPVLDQISQIFDWWIAMTVECHVVKFEGNQSETAGIRTQVSCGSPM
jgi:hypothetical protein